MPVYLKMKNTSSGEENDHQVIYVSIMMTEPVSKYIICEK